MRAHSPDIDRPARDIELVFTPTGRNPRTDSALRFRPVNATSPPDPRQYGRSFADVYDDWYQDLDSPDRLQDFAATVLSFGTSRPLLELGTGTGRLAHVLAGHDERVVGLDVSVAMLAQLDRNVPAGADGSVQPVCADMSRIPLVTHSVSTVVIAWNTLFNLASESGQRRCLGEIQRVLIPGGHLLIEAFIPTAPPDRDRVAVTPSRSTDDHAVAIATRQRAGDKLVEGAHLEFTRAGLTPRPWIILPQSPGDLDAMAAAAGLSLLHRWGDWDRRALGADDSRHISVYRSFGSYS